MVSIAKIFGNIKVLQLRVAQTLSVYLGNGPPLAFDVVPVGEAVQTRHNSQTDGQSLMDAVIGNGFLWVAVPKKRVTWERMHKRRHGANKMRWNVETKKNLVTCLQCGQPHLMHTVCGACYDKVRKETELMKAALDAKDPDAQMYNQPRTEVVYLYNEEADDREQFEGKYIVEMKRDRPTWWSKNLLTLAHGKRYTE